MCFQINPTSDEFKLINPLIRRLDKIREKKTQKIEESKHGAVQRIGKKQHSDDEMPDSDDDNNSSVNSNNSSDGEATSTDDELDSDVGDDSWKDEIRQNHKEVLFRNQRFDKLPQKGKTKAYELKAGLSADALAQSNGVVSSAVTKVGQTLADRLASSSETGIGFTGGRVSSITFTPTEKRKNRKDNQVAQLEHRNERRAVRRSAASISQTLSGRLGAKGSKSGRRG